MAGQCPWEAVGLDGTKTTWLKVPLLCPQIPKGGCPIYFGSSRENMPGVWISLQLWGGVGKENRELCVSLGRGQTILEGLLQSSTHMCPLVLLGALQEGIISIETWDMAVSEQA